MDTTGPYVGKTDAQVLDMARQALLKEAALPAGSIQRGIQGLMFDSCMYELEKRAFLHVLAALRPEQ